MDGADNTVAEPIEEPSPTIAVDLRNARRDIWAINACRL
jgi:hypothetical protein